MSEQREELSKNEHSIRLLIDDELASRLHLIPWGIRSEVIRKLLDMALTLTEKHGTMAIGAILDGAIDIVIAPSKNVQN